MKKLTIFVLFIMILSTFTVFAADTSDITLYINKEDVQETELTETAYKDADGNIMIPLRATMEAFGYKVEWIQKTKSIVIKESPIGTLTMQIGQKSVTYNDKSEFMDGSATIVNDKTYIPLNAMEILKHSTVVSTSPDSQKVVIYSPIQK